MNWSLSRDQAGSQTVWVWQCPLGSARRHSIIASTGFCTQLRLGVAAAQVLAVSIRLNVFHQGQIDADTAEHLFNSAAIANGCPDDQAHILANR